MTDTPETPAAKRRRLRWISLAEFTAVAGLVIAGASYWDSHRERAEVAAALPTPAPLLLTATADAARATLALKPAHPDAVIQIQQLIFPTIVRGEEMDTTGDARIEADWIASGIRRGVSKDRVSAPPRLPVGIVTVFIEGDRTRRDAAVYDIGYRMRGRWLQPYAIELEGITLVRRTSPTALKAAVDARWAAAIK